MTEVYRKETMITQELSQFREHDQLINSIVAYKSLAIRDIADAEGFRAVHRARMEVKSLRVAIEKTRKALKEDSLAFGRAVDAEAKRLTGIISPVETHLEQEEARIEAEKERIRREQEEKRQQVIRDRFAKLKALEFDGDLLATQQMTEEEFARVVSAATARKAEVDAAREQERVKAAAEAAEQARIKAEQDAAIAAERDRLAKIAAEQAAEQARIQAAQERVESERRQIEEAKREAARQEELRVAKEQAAERARIETEQRLARAAEEERERARKEAEAARRSEEERPYREKLKGIADTIAAIDIPPGSKTSQIRRIIDNCAQDIREVASKE